MLNETRKYFEDNCKKDHTISGFLIYEKEFSGYWKIIFHITHNCCDVIMDRYFDKFIFQPNKGYAKKVLGLYKRFYKQNEKLFMTHKIKPKLINAKELSKFVDNIEKLDYEFGFEMKKLELENRLSRMSEDFNDDE